MKPFLSDDFILENDTASRLYHDYAKDMPIIDYHCHLPPDEIAQDKKFENLSQIWLKGDHYKWRAMRTNGVDEKYCTGAASDWEKFEKWAETVPYTMRNPLYHWTHMELKNPFGIQKILNKDSAKEIYDNASEQLQTKYSVRNLLNNYKVEVVGTTDDPIDSLEHHKAIVTSGFGVKVLPTFRPDKAMAIDNLDSFNDYLNKLGEVANVDISTYKDFLSAIQKRHDYFAENGCKLSDHGLNEIFAADYSEAEIVTIFSKARSNSKLSAEEIYKFKAACLYEFAIMDHAKGWTQQFHLGAQRDNNVRLLTKLGPDTGFDSIGDFSQARSLSKFLNKLDSTDQLTKTILYNLNPADNELFATMIGNFQDGTIPGKLQFGSGWWFLDQKDGMIKQMNALSNLGLISRFVGMLTDSRSFLSFPRHEYFRRILCNLFGKDVENGELPNDIEWIGKMVQDICYNNAKNYFKF